LSGRSPSACSFRSTATTVRPPAARIAAGALSASVNTVSTHIRSIHGKLQVRDRSSAVQRARELWLLAAGRAR